MVTPPGKDGKPNPDIMAAAAIAGVDRVFLMGGAQAVAALAYGTESVPKVDKIVGPGNIFVATAKKLLYGTVDIDMIAGPSEILVLADESANPKFLAADLMSQAEHDKLASAILITTSDKLAEDTTKEIYRQVEELSRKDIIEYSLDNYGVIIVCDTMERAIELANELAPEHLEVCCENPMEYVGKLDNAGSVFWVTILQNHLAIILQVLTMFFQHLVQQDFSHRFLSIPLLRNQALFTIQRMLYKMIAMTL